MCLDPTYLIKLINTTTSIAVMLQAQTVQHLPKRCDRVADLAFLCITPHY